MLAAFARSRGTQRVRRAAFCAFVAAALATGGLAATGADISVESLQIGLVEGSAQVDRSTLGLDKGVIGDTVRVSALVRNDGTAAVGEFEVDFFFTEIISGEHGRLGTQVVSGLAAQEAKRPVIAFDTTTFSPGIYAFSAEADPRDALGDSDVCDNAAPRHACGTGEAESVSKYTFTLLREGRHLSRLSVADPFPLCRMGRLQTSLTVDVYNVGTETLSGSNLTVYGYYRLGLNPPANQFAPLVTDSSGNPVQLSKIVSLGEPGKAGSIVITLNYDVLTRLFAPSSAARDAGEVLGRPSPAQIRITVQPSDGSGTAQDLFLPEQFELSSFYSTVDLWTFPERSTCCVADCETAASVGVEPAVAGGLVFHVAQGDSGEQLYVLKIRTGEQKGTWPAPTGKTLGASVASYNETTEAYRVYVAASDGRIYALEGTEKEEGEFLTSLWPTGSADSVVKGETHLVLSADKTKLIVGSESGAFVLDVTNGQTLRKVTSHLPVTSAPVYADATGDLWIAADQIVYKVPASGSECSFDVKGRITTDLVRNARGTALFLGTETGALYALNPATCASLGDLSLLRSVSGFAVASKDDDAVIFVTSENGEAARVEYDHGRGFKNDELSARAVQPYAIAGAPAILPNAAEDDALAVFASGERRQASTLRPILVAWDQGLQKYKTVTVWGTSVPFLFRPEEAGTAPEQLLPPVVDPETSTLLVASSDGYLYAFDLGQYSD
jgi:hypothetical protein